MKIYKVTFQSEFSKICGDKLFQTEEKAKEYYEKLYDAAILLGISSYFSAEVREIDLE